MTNHRINKVLIANRGEIALRIQRTCDKLGIECVITVSEADNNLYFAKNAHQVAFISGSLAKDSYLNTDKILEAARVTGCDAIHPGYGFLSENHEFARKVLESGLIFIGPSPDCINALGNKSKARDIAKKCKVPITGGTAGDLTDEQLLKAATKIGYPLLIKAVAGGGGRGMRVISAKSELAAGLQSARAESKKFFADDRIYLEQYIEQPRHVEVQLVGDNYGNVIHLGTRDCSTQRRYQKLIEEAPAPNLSSTLRESIHKAALKIARYVGYNSVGTAEFLVAGNKFYFLEMNTRIQVEHPVTEEISALDLVELQIQSANGERLKIKQSQVKLKGHAIEFRINAENPADKFTPAAGKITDLKMAHYDWLRVESGYGSGDIISPFYDNLVAKLIVTGKNRVETLERAEELLKTYRLDGLPTTAPFFKWLLKSSQFASAPLDIGFIERVFKAEHLKEAEARELVDPMHVAGKKETLRYQSQKFKHDYQIEISHLNDGTFLFIPLNKKGKRAKEVNCRRSNGFNAAFSSLKLDVLEMVPPARI